jgi:type II secretory pathway component PulF
MARIRTGALIQLLRRVGTAHRAGVDLRTIWQKEAQHGPPGVRQQAAVVRGRLDAGNSLTEGLRACGDYFPPLARDLVEVGERTGRLDDVFAGLAEHYEHLLGLQRAFLIGISWPALQLTAAVFVIGLLIWVMGIIPAAGGQRTDILGFGLVGTSGLIKYLLCVGVVAAGITILVLSVARGRLAAGPMRLLMSVPVIGGCLRTSGLSRLAWTLSLALDSGVDARRAMSLALRATQNAYYTSQMRVVDDAITAGHEFHEALRATGLFPDEFLHALETAELSGTEAESMQRLAQEYRDRAKSAAKILTVAASFAVWGLVALILVALIFRLAFFYLNTIYGALKGF